MKAFLSGFVGRRRISSLHHMPRPLHDHDPEVVLEAERDIQSALGDRPFDFDALLAVSNIYRAATAVRNRMEREVLTPVGLTWGGFTILFVLWVWGDRETGELAEECGVAKGTLSGMVATLERSGLVRRSRHPDDGRKVVVHLEDEGETRMEGLFPVFNSYEARFTSRLDRDERHELARLLRLVTSTADEKPLVEP
jgi:DNA-binding MarR family transcriptional regulator